jgi:anthranilate synthase/aminodeoxychorismate synthase-like glutamine amidotransferase
VLDGNPRAIVISPGPGTPSRAGRCIDLVQALMKAEKHVPLLGVCLGHQAIGEAFGARIVRGGVPVHGKVTGVVHRGARLFANCDSPLSAARYHSLVVDRQSLPEELVVDAETLDGVVMAVSHRDRPIFGIQFHPESYGTVGGDQIIVNFLAVAGGSQLATGGETSPKTLPAASRQPPATPEMSP